MIKYIHRIIKYPSNINLWIFVFFFTITASILIQLLFLPIFLPDSINDVGLLLGSDSVGYHDQAVDMANKINNEGWSAWELAPKGLFMIGFTAIFYHLIYPEPWVILPISAMIHAFSGVLLFRIALFFTSNTRIALISIMPYLFFPSASMWYSQLLKDGYFNFGILLFIYGWLSITKNHFDNYKWQKNLLWGSFIVFGYITVGIIRHYTLSLMILQSCIISIVVIFFCSSRFSKPRLDARKIFSIIISSLLVISSQITFKNYLISINFTSHAQTDMLGQLPNKIDGNLEFANQETNELYWVRTSWIPTSIDEKISIISGIRKGYQDSGGMSRVDSHIGFSNVLDVFKYLPRATQIIFLSPFPNQWFEKGSMQATTIMRLISAVEMVFFYLLLPFLIISFYLYRSKIELWIIFSFSYSMMVLYSLCMPNVGTLYRMRYVYLSLFIILGMITLFDHLHNKNFKYKKN